MRKSVVFTFAMALHMILFSGYEAGAQLKMPSLFGDNMVLQQNSRVSVWGKGTAGEKVHVKPSWTDTGYETEVSGDGEWKLEINTVSAGGPFEMCVSSGRDTIHLSNISLGEVWICSGQSNMAMPVRGYTSQPVKGALQTVLESPAYTDRIRIFNVARDSSCIVRDDCTGKWSEATTSSVASTSAVAYGFAVRLTEALGVPVGIIVSAFGGTRIESWVPGERLGEALEGVIPERDIKKKYSIRNTGRKKPDQVGTIYNAMIAPLAPYAAKGFLWYQGCSNRKDYSHYAQMQTAMVDAWRNAWGDTDSSMPFCFVTIAPYSYGNSGDTSRARLVESQLKSLETIPNSYAAISEAYGEEDCIHPSDKWPVADQLAWNALVNEYGFSGLPSGYPYIERYETDGDSIVIYFANAANGLCPSYGEKIEGFMIAGKDRRFHKAEAEILVKPSRVVVRSPEVKSPVAVRYSFQNYSGANLTGISGVPVPPFRTDNWED